MYKIIRQKTGEIVDVKFREFHRIINSTTKRAAREIFQKIYVDLIKLYDQCIDQYYEYSTRRYSRHETGVGTGTGINLYRSSQIKFDGSELVIKINADDMAGYRPYRSNGELKQVDKEYVLDNVLSGVRGTPYDTGYGGSSMSWSASVSTGLLGSFDGTPYEIFPQAEEKIIDVASDYIVEELMKIIVI